MGKTEKMDYNGKWFVENGIEILIKPSTEFLEQQIIDNEKRKKEHEKNNILNKLGQLDIIVPRIIEDIIEQGGFTIHSSKLDIINQKKTLRKQLSVLEKL